MASSKEYLQFILGQLSELEEINYRAMMGEFILYYRGKNRWWYLRRQTADQTCKLSDFLYADNFL